MSEPRRIMMINVTHAEESRVAIVADGVLEAFEIETFDHKSKKGNIYKGRVESVQPGLQAAFVDVGGSRGGFLPLDEVNFKVHPARRDGGKGRIENHLHRGQELLVQVVRDAFANKPPTLSTYFSLPGRFLVLTPHGESSGISRKLDEKDRERVRKLLEGLRVPEGFGVIARTAGATATKTEMQRDLKYLLRLWEEIEHAAEEVRAPKLVYQESSLVIRAIRDLYTPDIDELLVDNEAIYQEIQSFFDVVSPTKKKSVKLYEAERPIFNKFNLEEQIENIFRRRVPLPSGGAVIFDTTEALTAVDVNSGRMKAESHIEETALKANLEAAQEITRQLRLRDLGGLIVIDFIDMRAQKNVRQVEKAMRDALKKDKAHYDVTRISSLGLMEISRERLNPQKSSLRYTDCVHCEGTGSVKTIEAAALQALRRLQTRVVRGDVENVEMVLPADVAEYLLNQKRAELGGWEERYRTHIFVKPDPTMIRDGCEIRTVVREKAEDIAPVVLAPTHVEILATLDEPEEEEEQAAAPSAASGAEGAPGEAPRKKRRRRRGGRKHRRGEAAAPAAEHAAQAPTGAERAEAAPGPAEAADVEPPAAEQPAGELAVQQETNGRRKRRRRRRRKGAAHEPAAAVTATQGADSAEPAAAAADIAAPPADIAAPPEPQPELLPEPEPVALAAGIVPTGVEPGPRPWWWARLIGAEPTRAS
ncbi:MAG: Rne/Rng family ribonuclease [Acidobacteria bacterium]|nr:Rne/Rng family ribonuclease [Acidobacteriota bacterium]